MILHASTRQSFDSFRLLLSPLVLVSIGVDYPKYSRMKIKFHLSLILFFSCNPNISTLEKIPFALTRYEINELTEWEKKQQNAHVWIITIRFYKSATSLTSARLHVKSENVYRTHSMEHTSSVSSMLIHAKSSKNSRLTCHSKWETLHVRRLMLHKFSISTRDTSLGHHLDIIAYHQQQRQRTVVAWKMFFFRLSCTLSVVVVIYKITFHA